MTAGTIILTIAAFLATGFIFASAAYFVLLKIHIFKRKSTAQIDKSGAEALFVMSAVVFPLGIIWLLALSIEYLYLHLERKFGDNASWFYILEKYAVGEKK